MNDIYLFIYYIWWPDSFDEVKHSISRNMVRLVSIPFHKHELEMGHTSARISLNNMVTGIWEKRGKIVGCGKRGAKIVGCGKRGTNNSGMWEKRDKQ